jgi:hypothetical protein
VNDDAARWLLPYLHEVDRHYEDQAPYTLTVTVKKVVFDQASTPFGRKYTSTPAVQAVGQGAAG